MKVKEIIKSVEAINRNASLLKLGQIVLDVYIDGKHIGYDIKSYENFRKEIDWYIKEFIREIEEANFEKCTSENVMTAKVDGRLIDIYLKYESDED